MKTVYVAKGQYRKTPVQDMTFELIKDYTVGKLSNFITVNSDGSNDLPVGTIRIKLQSEEDYFIMGDETPAQDLETDDEVMNRLRERFAVLEEMTKAACDGIVRGLVVTGPPGVGKSYGIETVMHQTNTFAKLAGRDPLMGVERGAASAIGLYQLLHQFSAPGSVLVLDDCDSVLWDEIACNLLKAALDSTKVRNISWRTESHVLEKNAIPTKFEFHGSVIFVTNLKFDGVRGRISDHLGAIMSRCHYLVLTLNTQRDKFLRCKQIVQDGMLRNMNFSIEEEDELMNYMEENKEHLREISLRMVKKVADLKKMNGNRWKRYAEMTCMKNK